MISKKDKYVSVLKELDEWVEVSEWAIKVSEKYPDLLEEANKQAAGQKRNTTGVKQIAGRMVALLTPGYIKEIQIDTSVTPRKVRWMSLDDIKEKQEQTLEDDIEPLTRRDIERTATDNFTKYEQYRTDEFWAISKQFKDLLNIDFEVDHAAALLNDSNPGEHHPDNLQLLTKIHNAKKNSKNYTKFDIEKQIAYIKNRYEGQIFIEEQQGNALDVKILEALLDRLRQVF